ncbi:hypothetical protein BDW59DRAFT_145774 [Aspergillus cavernicola]|uniref:Uncharacterized protein n=1 Tax=Aspergillus cavernicola TaxID=176166 RepID=A0ABR4IFM8_9EURO
MFSKAETISLAPLGVLCLKMEAAGLDLYANPQQHPTRIQAECHLDSAVTNFLHTTSYFRRADRRNCRRLEEESPL